MYSKITLDWKSGIRHWSLMWLWDWINLKDYFNWRKISIKKGFKPNLCNLKWSPIFFNLYYIFMQKLLCWSTWSMKLKWGACSDQIYLCNFSNLVILIPISLTSYLTNLNYLLKADISNKIKSKWSKNRLGFFTLKRNLYIQGFFNAIQCFV